MPERPWAEGDEDLAERQQEYNRKLGHLITTHREMAGILQKDLAERMGMSVRQWQRLEAGEIKHSPPIFFVKLIGDAIGVSLEQLNPDNIRNVDLDILEPPSAG